MTHLTSRKPMLRTASRRTEEVAEAFRADYRAYQYRFVEFYIDHVSDVSRAFKGDLQAVLVLAILGQVWLRAARQAEAAGVKVETLQIDRLSVNATRISDATGIPRQTVRRKLETLEKRGWICRNEDGSYYMAVSDGVTAAKRDLVDVDRRALERVAKLFVDLEALIDK